MKKLQEIFQELRCRKIVFEEGEVSKWLFEYASEYQRYSSESIDDIIIRKAEHMLRESDKVYVYFDRPLRLKLYSGEIIEEVARKDYFANQETSTSFKP